MFLVGHFPLLTQIVSWCFKEQTHTPPTPTNGSFPTLRSSHTFFTSKGVQLGWNHLLPFRSINLSTILPSFGFKKLSASKINKYMSFSLSRVSNLFLKHISLDVTLRETDCTGEIEQRCRYNVDLCVVRRFKNMNIHAGNTYIHIRSIFCDAMCSAVLPNCLARQLNSLFLLETTMYL